MRARRVVVRSIAAAVLLILALAAAWWLVLGRPVRYGALAEARLVPHTSSSPGVRFETLELTTTTGRAITCLLRSPIRSDEGGGQDRVPALLVAGGRRTGRRAALSVSESLPAVVIACDYPWADLARKRGAAFVLWLPRLRAEIVATPLMLGVVADYLLSREDVDAAQMAGVGASLGVPPVAAWAAHDRRVKAVALLYGGADLGAIFEANLEEDVPWRPLRGPVARVLGFLLRSLEPSSTVGAIAPRPVLVIGTGSDQWVPRRSVELMFASAGEPKRLVWFSGEHVRTTNEALIAALGDTTSAWLAQVLR